MNKLKRLLKKGINSNILKSIAIFAMLIDHVGYYFSSFLSNNIYTICRSIGRIAMPIFVYLLVQGFFHTKNLKKYINRIGIMAIITQAILVSLGLICKYKVKICEKELYLSANILFSFVITLVLLYIIHNRIIIKKYDFNKNMIIKILIVLVILAVYIFIPIDYSYKVPLMAILFYFIEKLRIIFYMSKSSNNFNLKKVVANSITEEKFKIIYILLIISSLASLVLKTELSPWMLCSVPFIALYNFEKGNDKHHVRTWYYIFFPLHHGILYSTLIIISLLKR